MLAWYRTLTGLRRAVPDFAAADLREVRVDVAGNALVLHRGRYRVVVTLGEGADVEVEGSPLEVVAQFSDGPAAELLGEGVRTSAESVVVLRVA